MFKGFFGPEDTANACGMFTVPHIISLIVCLALVGVSIYMITKISDTSLIKITKILAIVFTVTEIIKIIYKIVYSYTEYLDYYLPISYCSLFIYALWFYGFGKGAIKKVGEAFIAGGCIVGGMAFLIVPATSLMMHPIFHYLSFHSMLFHSAMVVMGVTLLLRNKTELNKNTFLYFGAYVTSAAFIAIVLNLITSSNLMLLSFPLNIPIDFVNRVAAKIPALYTVVLYLIYLIIPYSVAVIIQKIIIKCKKASVE
ncbi:MAG: YwaF family protein [Clostridia bacterium]|nr:YwaF family protein [Clostridia bacterium]